MTSWSIRPFAEPDTDAVVRLWHAAELTRPWNDPYLDIARKLTVQPELFLVAALDAGTTEGGGIVGTVMGGYDGHRGWLYFLASDPAHRREGIGRALVLEAERLMTAMGCPKIQLMVRPGNEAVLAFYDAIGYERFDVSTTGKRLIVDARP